MKRVEKRTLLSILPTLLVVIIVVSMTMLTYFNLVRNEQNRCWEQLQVSAYYVNEELHLAMDSNIRMLRLTASALMQYHEEGLSPEKCFSNLNVYREETGFTRIDLLNPDDTLQLRTGETFANPGIPFSEIAAVGECVSSRMNDPATGNAVVNYYVPVEQNGEVAAVLVGVLDCDSLSDMFQIKAYDGQVSLCIVDRSDGTLILDGWNSRTQNLFEAEERTLAKRYEGLDLISEIQNGREGTVAYRINGSNKYSYMVYTPFDLCSWELLCFVREDVAFASLKEVKQIVMYFGIVEGILLLLYFCWNMYNLNRLSKSKRSSEQQLLISNTLIQCIKSLSSYTDINIAINSLLQTLNTYFDGDRTYLFELNYEKQTISNTYEYTAEGISKEIDHLQDVPLSVIATWIRKFEEEGSFYISHIDKDVHKDSDTYKILEAQGIESLVAVPLVENDVIIGFLGVDNPKQNYRDLSLLSSTTFFILDSLERRKYQQSLERLSFEDTLTELYNRNKFNQILEQHQKNSYHSLGVAYFDLNGLKAMNDQLGHTAGDNFIRNTASIIKKEFGNNAYRIGGDEFTVIVPDISKTDFNEAISRISSMFKENHVSVSIGTSWAAEENEVSKQLHEADIRMYADKEHYYSGQTHDRRTTV